MLSKLSHVGLCIIGFFVLNNSLWAQSTSNPLITEMVVTNNDSTYRYLYLYNASGQKTLETKYVSVNGEWKRRLQTEWIYSDNVCIYQYFRNWSNNNWDLSHEIEYAYYNGFPISEKHIVYADGTVAPSQKHSKIYSDNKIITETDSIWDNSKWTISTKTNYIYGSLSGSNNLDTLYFTKFNNGIQDTQSRIAFSYDNASLLLYKQTYSEKKDADWINSFQTTTYYNPVSMLKSYQTKKVWNCATNSWDFSENITFGYTAANKLEYENYQHWNSQFWINDVRYEYTYDSSGSLIKKASFMPIYNDFRPASSINYSEFENGKASLIEAKNEFWGGETGSLINTFIPFQFNDESTIKFGSKIRINYVPVNDTGIITSNGSSKNEVINVYPNPSDGIFYFDTQKYDVENWTVYDITGKAILSKTVNEKTGVIDLTDFQQGVYFLKAKSHEKYLSQKLIKK